MKREELKICLAIDATAFYDNNEEMYAKAEADSVMDEMEMTLACYEDEVHKLRKQLEDVQNAMATENVDFGMENHKLKERIKELEYRLRDKGGKNAELQATNSALRKRIKELETALQNAVDGGNIAIDVAKLLESSQPKWISVDERLPTKRDADYDGKVLASSEEYPRGFLCECDNFNSFNITHWMPLPHPPSNDRQTKRGLE